MASEHEEGAPPVAAVDEDDTAAISLPDSGDAGEGGKLKVIMQLLKKCLGVKDIASMRLSLPASMMEPVPNLEYMHYFDRPDMFAAINDSDDPFERMLAAVRFAFTKDLKFIHGKVVKSYNSTLGEHFRAHWDFQPVAYPPDKDYPPIVFSHTDSSQPIHSISSLATKSPSAETDSIRSGRSSKSAVSRLSMTSTVPGKNPSTAPTSVEGFAQGGDSIRVVYLTEQVSHHPPISAYYGLCPTRGVELYGIDQMSIKVSGTTVRVACGTANKGIFVKITGGHGEGETYQITHPVATINGILRGNFYVTVADSTIITCTGGRGSVSYRAILEYKEESWLGKPHFLTEGVIHVVHDGETGHEEWTRVKHVPKNRVVAVFEGTWRGLIKWKRTENFFAVSSVSSSPSPSHEQLPVPPLRSPAESKADLFGGGKGDWAPLIDLSVLRAMPKSVRPLEKQLPNESRKLWDPLTVRLLKKEYSEGTKVKLAIEQRQRDLAAERKKKGIEFIPKYFDRNYDSGIPALTQEGRKVVEEELLEEPFELAGAVVVGSSS